MRPVLHANFLFVVRKQLQKGLRHDGFANNSLARWARAARCRICIFRVLRTTLQLRRVMHRRGAWESANRI